MKLEAGETVQIDMTTLPVVDKGFELQIDVNNKPLLETPGARLDSTKALVDQMRHEMGNEANKFMGFI